MGKFISLGEYNKLYKYLWIYLGIKFISEFLFTKDLVFEPLKNDAIKMPSSPFILYQINYFGFIAISSIIMLIQMILKKKESYIGNLTNVELIYNEIDIDTEYGMKQSDYFIYINIFFVVVTDLLDEIFFTFQCEMFNYWMFEMLFFERFIAKYFKTKIYKHHIFSLLFIICFCSIMQIVIIILNFLNNTEDVKIFDNREWLIPFGIIVYFLMNIFRAYFYNNEKYYLEKINIPIPLYIFIYGIFGFIVNLICIILSTYIPCGDNSLPELWKIVCQFNINEEVYYFDSYIIFFKEFASNYLGLRILFKIIDTILYYIYNYYRLVVYKTLNPIYHICMRRLCETIFTVLDLINYLVNNDNIQSLKISLGILNILLLTFYVFGSIVYLEFIELNFCELNFYVKRKIKERSNLEIITEMDNISVNSDTSNSEKNTKNFDEENN